MSVITGTSNEANYPDGAEYYCVDFMDDNSVSSFIKFLKKKPINILVNNAGINKISSIQKLDEKRP